VGRVYRSRSARPLDKQFENSYVHFKNRTRRCRAALASGTMARKKVSRTLALLPSRRALEKAHHKTETLTAILRDVAVKNQHEQPRAFHSVREVAAHFRVPVSTVSRVYRTLEQEGLLSRVRGSKTLLQGLHFDRQLKVRAFVGFPASVSRFVTLQDYRTFFIRIRRELRLRGFAAATAFFEPAEAASDTLAKRFKAYEVDTVIWFQPGKEARTTALHLADMGIRLLGIANDNVSPIGCRYEVRREPAIRTLLANWKEQKPERVVLVESKEQRAPALTETLHTVLDELEIHWAVARYENQRSEAFLRELQRRKADGIIFSSSALASRFCFRAPGAVAELLQAQRVAFIDGPVSMPFARVPDVKVDLVTVNWQMVAETIVDDLISQDAFQASKPTVFDAEARLCVPLSEFAQSI
jgi:IclR helix-turn-helix domain